MAGAWPPWCSFGVRINPVKFYKGIFGAISMALATASIVMLTMTLGSVNLPLEGVALMTGIDRIIGGQRTLPNVITNATISAMLDRQEKIEQGQQPV